MMKNTSKSTCDAPKCEPRAGRLLSAAAWIMVYGLLALLLYLTCRYQLCLIEDFSTFYYDWSMLGSLVFRVGGVADAISLFFAQWFVTPVAAVMVASIVLTAMTAFVVAYLRRLGSRPYIYPVAVFPAVAAAYMQCNPDYSFGGTVALSLAAMSLLIASMRQKPVDRLVDATLMTLVLWYAAGAVSMLYGVVVVIGELMRAPRRSWMFVVCPALAAALGMCCVHCGLYGDMYHAVTPLQYYVGWLKPFGDMWLPWVAVVMTVVVGTVGGRFDVGWRKVMPTALILISAMLASMLARAQRSLVDTRQGALARAVYYLGEKDYDRVIHDYRTMPRDDTTLQSCVNLALAERDQLGDRLFHHANAGVSALYNPDEKSRLSYVLQSDIYYAMGLVALGRRYAFEANEAMGNLSPRMLMRLVDTNLVSGRHDVARRYIDLLERTAMYASWARGRRALLGDDEAVRRHPELGPKAACLPQANHFAGDGGIDSDLLEVLRANPGHKVTMQYLGAMCLLSRNVPRFMALIDEFCGTPAVRMPLPEHYQEAVVVATIVTGEPLDNKYQIHPSVMQRCRAFWAEHQPQPNTFWHYLRAKQ